MCGVPAYVVSDNGSQFKANYLNAFFISLGIIHMYSPLSKASERVNSSIVAGIRLHLKIIIVNIGMRN